MDESTDLQNGGEKESTETKMVNDSEVSSAEHQPSEDQNQPSEDKTENLENGTVEIKIEEEDEEEMDGGQEEAKVLHNCIDKNDEHKGDASDESPRLPKRTRSRTADGKEAEKVNGPELRKRRASTGQTSPAKRSRANSSIL